MFKRHDRLIEPVNFVFFSEIDEGSGIRMGLPTHAYKGWKAILGILPLVFALHLASFGTAHATDLTLTIQENGVGIGIATPEATLDVNGTVWIRGGSPGNGRVLTSNASGLASWQPLPSFDLYQPSLGVRYIIATEGTYPNSRRLEDQAATANSPAPLGSGASQSTFPYVGMISLFAGTITPDGWADCDGSHFID